MKIAYGMVRYLTGMIFITGFVLPLTLGFASVFTVLCAVMGIGLIVLPALIRGVQRVFPRRHERILKVTALFLAAFLLLFSVEGILILSASGDRKSPEKDATVIVLGATVLGTVPSLELSGRIQKAADYLQSHPDAVCIATGGVGSTASISEADCIRRELVERHLISSDRIFKEESSTSTMENLENAVALLESRNLSKSVVLVTGEYHMFRAKLLAGRIGLTPFSGASSTDLRIFLHSYLRELFAIPKSVLFDIVSH